MAYTLSDLEAIERAIATGARRVKFEDREVEYRSTTELERTRDSIRRALGLGDEWQGRRRASFDKDL